GQAGVVVGADLEPVVPLPAANVRLVTGDVREPPTVDAIRAALGRPADVVLSDLAPKLTGVRASDQARSAELADATVAVTRSLLRPGGHLLMKVFMGPGYEDTIRGLRGLFAEVRTTRP